MRYLEVGPFGCFCGSVSSPETLLASLLRPQDSCCGSHLMSSSDEISPQEWELMGCVEVHIASPCCTNTSLQNSAAQKSFSICGNQESEAVRPGGLILGILCGFSQDVGPGCGLLKARPGQEDLVQDASHTQLASCCWLPAAGLSTGLLGCPHSVVAPSPRGSDGESARRKLQCLMF